MFGAFQSYGEMMKALMQLMKDERFRKLMANPKVQGLLKDPEFLQLAQAKDITKIKDHPKFGSVMNDPEVAELMSRFKERTHGT
ncbi:MAG: hypothetical protein Q8R76_05390 [Candidatus Omnitrophota bacterium]|nr:hypothetical protein [Candidatus Omnitrophota bacterium]